LFHKMFIYVLKLCDEKYYVGRTENVSVRVRSHFDGVGGAAWTKKYRPIDVCETFVSHDPFDEDKTTLEYMKKYGVENVRGGSFCRVSLTNSEKHTIQQMLRGSDDRCFKCGESGHFAKDCTESLAYEPWSHEEDEQLREEQERGLTVAQMSEIHRRSQGAIRSRLKRVGVQQPLLTTTTTTTVEEDENLCCCLI
jgi:predicted GIY-YIG superfamily endonuclease